MRSRRKTAGETAGLCENSVLYSSSRRGISVCSTRCSAGLDRDRKRHAGGSSGKIRWAGEKGSMKNQVSGLESKMFDSQVVPDRWHPSRNTKLGSEDEGIAC